METKPTLSVVMTVYNDGLFVVDAIESILDQSFTDFEFIIVDDGAIDDSVEKVRQFDDDRIRLIRQENQGLAAALNVGIRASRGELVARQDADDISAPGRLEHQVEFLRKHPEVGLVGGDIRIIDEDGNEIQQRQYPRGNETLQKALISGRGNPFAHGSVMFGKSLAEEVGLYRPAFKKSQDLDLWLRIAEITQLANIPKVLYSWRSRRGAIGTANWGAYGNFARLAIWCAKERARGRPEPPLEVENVTRGWFIKLTQRLRTVDDPDLSYDFLSAQTTLLNGNPAEARPVFRKIIAKQPSVLYAWILYGLSFMPARAACAIWNILRFGFRSGTWKR